MGYGHGSPQKLDSKYPDRKIRQKKHFFAQSILDWSVTNSPTYSWRNTSDPYLVLVAELLLRRTRAESVQDVYITFIKKFPSISVLSKSTIGDISSTIKSLGLLSRSHKIKSIAKQIVKQHNGIIPHSEDELIKIIGSESHYTTNAVRCFAMDKRVPIFDVNVKRILERVFSINLGKSSHKNKLSWKIATSLLPAANIKQYNWAILDIGKSICINNTPKCKICPLRSICDYALKQHR